MLNSTTSGNIRFFNNMLATPASGSSGSYTNAPAASFTASSGNIYVINNILLNVKLNTNFTGANGNVIRNIYSTYEGYEVWLVSGSAPADITTTFNDQLNTTLQTADPYDGVGHQVYDFKTTTTPNSPVIAGLGGTITSLASDLGMNSSTLLGNLMSHDQMGRLRPENISIGPVDLPHFTFKTTTNLMESVYNSKGTPATPPDVSLDLYNQISGYPIGVTPHSGCTFSVTQLDNTSAGSVSLSGSTVTYHPTTLSSPTYEMYSYFTVTVTATAYGYTNTASFIIRTHVFDRGLWLSNAALPPGYTDPSTTNCYGTMAPVTFSPVYKFITGATGATNYAAIKPYVVPEGDAQTSPAGANSTDRLYGFSIPLVGDLNGDGYPEIVAEGQADGVSSYNADIEYLYIYDGQTGKRILKYALPAWWEDHTVYHDSPSHIALVDADRNGLGEIIVAYGVDTKGGTTSKYNQQVASYEVTVDANKKITGLTEKWVSTTSYAAGAGTPANYSKPIPQIVDIDGDGVADIVVYNHIYNAQTGALEATLGTLGTDAFVGYDAGATVGNSGDRWINFDYTYDMDEDGKYDVVAGGKVYYDINLSNGTYKTVSLSGVPDGRTGVADINGDGIPDVVSVTRESSSDLRVSVWNPGFLSKDASGSIVRNSTPEPYLMEQVDLPMGASSTGNNSYVYIGDIDGHEQMGTDGIMHRLPEIAILSGQINMTTVNQTIGVMQSDTVPIADRIPLVGEVPSTLGTTTGYGVIVGLTWDLQADTTNMAETTSGGTASGAERLKVSFLMEHNDSSVNTGFTMFDFDNDGIEEICYRDESTLRIIKPIIPYIRINENRSSVILLKQPVASFTGFEYPVIADIDNDGSADMIVMGSNVQGYYGFVYAISSAKEKFAPALPVWNQFMYDPFKIKPNLQVPQASDNPAYSSTGSTPPYPAPNRLNNNYTYQRIVNEGTPSERLDTFALYNATLSQVPKYMLAANPTYGSVYEPIVYFDQGYIVDNEEGSASQPKISGAAVGNDTLTFTVGNREGALTDVPINTPVAIYKNGLASQANYVGTVTLGECYIAGTNTLLTAAIKANSSGTTDGEVRLSLPMLDTNNGGSFAVGDVSLSNVYLLRLGDNSNNSTGSWVWRYGINDANETADPDKGIGVASSQFRDCSWDDNAVIDAKSQLIPDLATVQAYHAVTIDQFANDILPDDYYANYKVQPDTAQHTLNTFSIYEQPKAGTVTLSGSGQEMKMNYRNTSTEGLVNSVDSFRYRAIFTDPNDETTKTDIQTVYIYILQLHGGAATCSPSYKARLKAQPVGVAFRWYMADSTTYLQTDSLRDITFAFGNADNTGDSVYMVEPKVTASFATDSLQGLYFPQGQLRITKTNSGAADNMRWTGQADRDWDNPANWVMQDADGSETPADYAPTPCTNVTISSNVDNYPELVDSAYCHDIDMQDRAMLKNPHVLNYDSARVEIKLKPSERDRYLMWSAPMLDMVAGDYHFDNPTTGEPEWGDFQLSLFMGFENSFSSSQALVGTFLPLGKAFNLKLTTTSQNADSVLWFPKPNTEYTGIQSNISFTGTYKRTNLARFVTDDMEPDGKGDYLVPVRYFNAQLTSGTLLQVVNPYFAYLNFADFYQANADSIQDGYYLWDGKTDDGFVGVVASSSARYLISSSKTDFLKTSPNQIPPLQSFIVAKNEDIGSAVVHDMRYSPAFTSTQPAASYTLRAANVVAGGLLQIGLTEGTASASAGLVYDLTALPGADKHDLPALTSDAMPLSLYTLDAAKNPLLMNSSDDFAASTVPLVLSAASAGEATLTFTGLDDFGYDVYLTDKTKGKEIKLSSAANTYTFTLDKSGSVTDRFSLRFVYTGQGVVTGTDETTSVSLRATALPNGGLEVRGLHPGTMLYIYDMSGRMLYCRKASAESALPDVRLKGLYTIVNDGRSVKVAVE
ncbi:MAG: VCBS repeat-containing protein [Tannerella sp.]|nr:VCBS repeat-containing protein [Tannerella sp.]